MSDALKNKKSIGEIEDSYGIPAWMGKTLLVHFSNIIEVGSICEKASGPLNYILWNSFEP